MCHVYQYKTPDSPMIAFPCLEYSFQFRIGRPVIVDGKFYLNGEPGIGADGKVYLFRWEAQQCRECHAVKSPHLFDKTHDMYIRKFIPPPRDSSHLCNNCYNIKHRDKWHKFTERFRILCADELYNEVSVSKILRVSRQNIAHLVRNHGYMNPHPLFRIPQCKRCGEDLKIRCSRDYYKRRMCKKCIKQLQQDAIAGKQAAIERIVNKPVGEKECLIAARQSFRRVKKTIREMISPDV